MATFAERLNEALMLRNVTAAQLSRAIDVNEATISNYKNGKYVPKQRRTQEIATFLNVPIAWLMGADVPVGNDFFLSPHEKKVIIAYRKRSDVRNSVDILLGISQENQEQEEPRYKIAARSGAPIAERPLTESERLLIESGEEWHGDDDL